jgi:hypothetical protein
MPSASYLRQQARRCRDLADGTMDQEAARTLRGMAAQYEEEAEQAEEAERPEGPPLPTPE